MLAPAAAQEWMVLGPTWYSDMVIKMLLLVEVEMGVAESGDGSGRDGGSGDGGNGDGGDGDGGRCRQCR